MAKIAYKRTKMRPAALRVIIQANQILEEYEAQGFDLTLRQLYYQFVARGLIPNKQSEYKRLGDIVNDGRLAGHIDWDHIVDRTRNLRAMPHWADPADIIKSSASQFRVDKWADQDYRLEVWIEKDALVGVIQGVCNRNQVPYFSCRGYTSQSEMWGASQRLKRYLDAGQGVRILHLGDHDPSGIDMTRDIEERTMLFLASHAYWGDITDTPPFAESDDAVDWVAEQFQVDRLALNMDQVRQYDPPPNPAKLSDSRAGQYVARHGYESWELDALPPDVMDTLIEEQIWSYRDEERWEAACEAEQEQTDMLKLASQYWDEVVEFLKEESA